MILQTRKMDNGLYQGVITCEQHEHPDQPNILLKGQYQTIHDAMLHCTKICDDMSNGITRPDAVEAWWDSKEDVR